MQNSQNKIITLGILLFFSGFVVLTNNYFNEKIDNAYSYMNNLLLTTQKEQEILNMQEEVEDIGESTSSSENNEKVIEYVDPYLKYYVGSIEIPKIGLNSGFTSLDSPYNTVNKNIEIVKGSTYPNIKNGNFILAAHSGNSYLAYFKNLYKLALDDIAYINYNGHRYTYKIVNIYQQEKTGKIVIYRDTSKTTMTLVTCTKDSKTEQTIYILELVEII